MKKATAKAVAWIATLVIMVMMIGVVSFAEGEASNYVMTAGASTVNVGETMTVTISCKDMTVSSFAGGFRFDTSRFEVTAISDDVTKAGDAGGYFTALSSVEEANAAGTVGFAKAGTKETLVTAKSLVTVTLRAKNGGAASLTLYEDSDGINGVRNDAAQIIGIGIEIVKDYFPAISDEYEGPAQAVHDGTWYYLKKGRKVDWNKAGLYYHQGTDTWFYFREGRVDESCNNVVQNENGWWKVTNGRVDFSYTGVANNENGWWKITNGKVDFGFNGFERNTNGWWYLENGKVNFDKNDVIKGKANSDPTKKGEDGWWLVRDSRVQNVDTVAQNSNGWWKITGGKVDFSYTGVANNENGWWKITGGKVDFGFKGFERNANGWWYLENGKVNFNKDDVIKGKANSDPTKKGEDGWWLVRGSRVQNADTVAQNVNGWWKIVNGKVDFSYKGVANNENGWWKITGGKVDFGFNGFERNANGWWYLENGKVNFNKNDVIYAKANTDPAKGGEAAWWLVRGSRVENADTVARNANGWWKIVNGRVDFTYTGVANNENGWWKITGGKVDFGFNGFERNANGWWYLENGKVSFNKNDVIYGNANTDPTLGGEAAWWLVRGSRVENTDTVAKNANGWWKITGGKVDFSFTGIADNENGSWRIENGKVNFGFTGLASNEEGLWYLKDGKVDLSYNGTYDGKTIVNGKAE